MLDRIAEQFCASAKTIKPLGNGFINDTYKVETDGNAFVLQRINRQVFPYPEQIMANLQVLSRHAEHFASHESGLKIPRLYPTLSRDIAYQDANGQFWRAWEYIDNTESLEQLGEPGQASEVGKALGQFHRLTGAIAIECLFDTLPGFHIAPRYFEQYQQIRKQTTVPEDFECAEFIENNKHIINDLEDAKVQGLLKVRVIHGDPKLNNFLFDKTSGQIVSLIDLDTVKPGLIHYDIGDCLRSCCHKLANDTFDLGICRALMQGYLQIMGDSLTQADIEWFFPAVRLIPFELGLRFYSDYLNGNRYFKVTLPEENLTRAKSQFALYASVIAQESEIKATITRLLAESGGA